ncbi:pleiotropic drug resistance protein 3-like [Rhodamnia argentea]|uniref:Pleiotropic drug resistance protein 3-like n=1 Tax=Rhodamnia argentea TaxID=178133 RepID=A0ABM3HM19_9MYRT|nr:pleiotropic drug resistance protein 3-like [Rhodamnia argentea]
MAQSSTTSNEPASPMGIELSETEGIQSQSFSSPLHHRASSSFSSVADSGDQKPSTFGEDHRQEDDELELQWAAIHRLPTFRRLRAAVLGREVVDVMKVGDSEGRVFVDGLLKRIEEDNLRLLQNIRERVQRVGLELPTVEVRYQNLCIEAESEAVHGEHIPTLWNALKTIFYAPTNKVGCRYQGNKIRILENIGGILKPARMTLLLGPPGCGKTTLLQALAGKSEKSLEVKGQISYNGYKLNEFVPQKTSAYTSQYDVHISEMTVRETLDFSARCQGIGGRADMLKEVSKREKQMGINPDTSIDTYMKAISIGGLKRTLQTDYILKVLGLDICADTVVGDAMIRGISGGQKRRLTTGEMIIGPARVLFMDEISTGLDSSTTFQIITCLQQLAHITEYTILVSLLQPAPETFDLFDDIILMAEGHVVYHGPRTNVLNFFGHCGFKCPTRKGIADFLQEVVSKKDQAQYWHHKDQTYCFISPSTFARMFQEFPMGKNLDEELARPLKKTDLHRSALTFEIYSLKKWELFKACLSREWLLMKRNCFVHVFKSAQLVVIAVMTVTVFWRPRMKLDLVHADLFMGSLYYALIRLMVIGIQELAMTVSRLSVFYKQRDFFFYPAWAYTIPAAILKIPFSLLDAFLWTAITYYGVGYSPEPQRFFYQFILLFLLHQVSLSMFRLIASVVRNPPVAAICSLFSLLVLFLFGGFVISKPSLPGWLKWGFWLSPLSYAEIGASINEFLAPRWQKVSSLDGTLGQQVLRQRGLDFTDYFYWISVGSLIGFWMVFNIGFTCALSFSIGMVLTFEPTTLTFENIQYFVETPKKLREHGVKERRLQLLQDITGAFRPGVLTALMGISGAGKTTLMDVLSGRKTSGSIEGDIKVGGYPKVQVAYARISGYCEQTDIHSPQVTIEESVAYSAWLRLPAHIDTNTRAEFVAAVLEMIELDDIKGAIVGVPGVTSISTEQRKRLTIAVELVSNPSILFMDEPTSGLDARAAAIVMRVVKNIVSTGRTIVCTIHQPSIDVFEAFDELILLKRGGQMIYSGELGEHSNKLIKYFESIPGVPKIKDNYNPATWMLEITSSSVESQLGIDYGVIYKESDQCRTSQELVRELSLPVTGKEICFAARFPQNRWVQFKTCLWKQHLTYWRSPKYNLVRLLFITASSLLCAALLWQKGKEINDEQDLLNILGSMFIFVQMTGIGNCNSVLPFVATERIVVYRERFAGMYSSWSYSFAQVVIEIPYVFLQTVLFVLITFPAIGFYVSFYKVFWYFYTMFCTLLYFNYFGMMLVSLTPTYQVAVLFASFFYTTFNLFAGFLIPGPDIPVWWRWCYWICPNAWSLRGLLSSQYGDIHKEITVQGQQMTISAFLENYFGYHYDQLYIVAIVLSAFPLIFTSIFACAIAKVNFQKR